MEYKDALGQEIKPGQIIAYPTASSNPVIKISIVDKLTTANPAYNDKLIPSIRIMGLHQKCKGGPDYHWEEEPYFSTVEILNRVIVLHPAMYNDFCLRTVKAWDIEKGNVVKTDE